MIREPQPQAHGRRSWTVRLLYGLSIALALFGVATARVLLAGEQEIAASTAALDAGDAADAIVHARRAAEWYAPGAPHVAVAYARLAALARAAESRGRSDLALQAWSAVRLAARSTRWLVQPHERELGEADQHIARLQNAEGDVSGSVGAEQLALLRRDETPRAIWAVALVVSFALWAGGLGWWARSVAGAGGKPDWQRARTPLLCVLAGLALWLAAFWQA